VPPKELFAVALLFGLSLGAAWVLFKVLGSTAAVTRKEYQLGGAAAGFLIIYSALYGSYSQLVHQKIDDIQKEAQQEVGAAKDRAAACDAKLAIDEREIRIGGTVSPVERNATVILAVKAMTLPDNGRFILPAKGVDPKKDDVAIYIIGDKRHAYIQLQPEDDASSLKIDLKEQ
jgi:hypothetical protein